MPIDRVCVLGPLQARQSGETVGLGGPRQLRLLAILLARRGEVVSEDALVEGVWGDSGDLPADPHQTVQLYVSRARGQLGAEAITTFQAGYQFDGTVVVDADEFEAGLLEAQRLAGSGDLDEAGRLAGAALDLWQGAAFGGLDDVGAVDAEARRLDELRVTARELLLEIRAESGAAEVIADAEALLREYPLRESPVQALALARYRRGQQAEALRDIGAFRDRLAEETGLEPSPKLVDLEQQILNHDPQLEAEVPRRLGAYELGDQIGEGAFGAIFLATQPSVGREVAIKVVRAELANDPQFVRRFEVEAQTVAHLEHPHIVPLHDFWRDPSGAYLVMRYLRGGSAEAKLMRDGPWTLVDVARLVDEIGPALAVAHQAGVVHRDVKPANILFDEAGNSYLADFGIAAATGSTPGGGLELRSAGSPLYVSPEQVRDGVASAQSDIYAFGVVLFELLTGEVPFGEADSVQALLARKLTDVVPSIIPKRPDVPAAVDMVIQTATAVDPARRFESMSELVLAFRAATGGPLADAASTSDVTASRPRQIAGQTLVSVELEAVNPYKGLAPFGEADAGDFFGRGDLVDELAAHQAGSRFLVVAGPSGSGKSSVVRAGLVPRLRESGAFVATIVPGVHPFDEVETALLRVATEPPGALLEQLTADERGLGRAVKRILPDDDSELVLVIDQFEELFTLTDSDSRDEFLTAVAAAVADPRSRLRVVCTLRADFYDRPLQHASVSDLVRINTVAVSALSPGELEAAITGPAARVGVNVEAGLVAELVAEVRGHPAALPLLQYALTETYEERVAGVMTLDAYRDLGGISGALANRADEVYSQLSETRQEHARRMFTRLITPGEGTEDTRRRVLRSELAGIDADVMDVFGGARLLAFDTDPSSREPTVEVAHEAIIREWPRLRGWLEEDRDGLRTLRHLGVAAQGWAGSARDPGELYRGGRLETAEDWVIDHPDQLNLLEAEFLTASQAAHQSEVARQRRTNRRLIGLLIGAAIALVIALVAGVFAAINANEADDQRAEAETQAAFALTAQGEAETQADAASQAQSAAEQSASDLEAANDALEESNTGLLVNNLTLQSTVVLPTDRVAAMLLAVEGFRLSDTAQGRGALLAAVTDEPRLVEVLPAMGDVSYVQISPDGRLAALGGFGTSFLFWDLEAGQVAGGPYELNESPSWVEPFDFSPDGSKFAIVKAGEPNGDPAIPTYLDLYDTDSLELLLRVQIPDAGSPRAVFDPTGTLLAVTQGDLGTGEGWVRFYDVATLEEVGELLTLNPLGLGLTFSSDGTTFLTADLASNIKVFDSATHDQIGEFSEPHGEVSLMNLALSPDGQTLVSGDLSGGVRFWDVATRTPLSSVLTEHADWVRSVKFSDDGALLVTTSDDGSAVVWDVSARQPIDEPLQTQAGAVWGADFSPGSHELIVTTSSGVAQRWDVESAGAITRELPVARPAGDLEGAIALDPVRDHVAVITVPSGTLTLRDLTTGEVIAGPVGPPERRYPGELLPRPGRIAALPSFSEDGSLLVTGYSDGCLAYEHPEFPRDELHPDSPLQDGTTGCLGSVHLRDPQTLELLGVDVVVYGGFGPYALNSDSTILAVATNRGYLVVELFDTASGERIGDPLIPPAGESDVDVGSLDVASLAFRSGPDGVEELFVNDQFDNLFVWRVASGGAEFVIRETFWGVRAAVSPDGTIVVSSGRDGTTEIRGASSPGVSGLPLERPTADVLQCVGFSPDGNTIVGATDSGDVFMWDLVTGQLIGDQVSAGALCVEFSADGRNVVTGGTRVRVQAVDPALWADAACGVAGRSLTEDEWARYVGPDQPYVESCD